MIKMTHVDSSNILEIGYDKENQEVHVRFKNCSVYVYKRVPQSEFKNLLHASSVGSYLQRNYINVYSYKRIE